MYLGHSIKPVDEMKNELEKLAQLKKDDEFKTLLEKLEKLLVKKEIEKDGKKVLEKYEDTDGSAKDQLEKIKARL